MVALEKYADAVYNKRKPETTGGFARIYSDRAQHSVMGSEAPRKEDFKWILNF